MTGLASKRLAAVGVGALPRLVNFLGTRAAPAVAASSLGMGGYEAYQSALKNQPPREILQRFKNGLATGGKQGLLLLPVEPLLEFLPALSRSAGGKALGEGGQWWGQKAGELLQRQAHGAAGMAALSGLQVGEARRPGQAAPTLGDYWSAIVESIPTGVAFGSLPSSPESRTALKASPFAGEATPERAGAFVDRIAPSGEDGPSLDLRKLHELAIYQTANPELPDAVRKQWGAVARETARRQGLTVDGTTGLPAFRVEKGRRFAVLPEASPKAGAAAGRTASITTNGAGQAEVAGTGPAAAGVGAQNPAAGGTTVGPDVQAPAEVPSATARRVSSPAMPAGRGPGETGVGVDPPGGPTSSPPAGAGGKLADGSDGPGSKVEPGPSADQDSPTQSAGQSQGSGSKPRSVRELIDSAHDLMERYAAARPRLSAAIERAVRGGGITELRRAVGWAQERAAKAEATRTPNSGNGDRAGAADFSGSSHDVAAGSFERDAATRAPAGVEAPGTGIPGVLPPLSERIIRTFAESRESARNRIAARSKEQRGRLNAGFDPSNLPDYALIGSTYIAEGAIRFVDWQARMVADLGKEVRPYLPTIWRAAREHYHGDLSRQYLLPGIDEIDHSLTGHTQRAAPESGPHGPVLRQYRYDAPGAIAKLTQLQAGEAIGALHHPAVGDIDLIWGEEGTGAGTGFGLSKIVARHPEVLSDLQGIVSQTAVVERSGRRVVLESPTHRVVVHLTYEGKSKRWLMTAFQKGTAGASAAPPGGATNAATLLASPGGPASQ